MKKIHKSLLWLSLVLLMTTFQSSVYGQDDLYYETPSRPATNTDYVDDNNEPSNVTRRYSNDDTYYEDDDYAYEYAARIRRFHRPVTVVDYYDPFFVDLYNYDPYYLPGTTIYTYGYNDYWTWRRWNRWNRWNTWNFIDYGWGYNSFGWNSWGCGFNNGFGYNSWNNPYVFNNFFYDPYWTVNGYNPYYCNNGWGNNNFYNNNNNNNDNGGYKPKTYTGARRNGTNINPGYARIDGNDRLTGPKGDNVQTLVPNNRQNGRAGVIAAPVPNVSDRDKIGRQNTIDEPARNPNVKGDPVNGRESAKPTSREAEISRRLQEGQRNSDGPTRTPDVDNNRRNPAQSPSRNQDTPTRRSEPATIERPSRSSGGGREESAPQRTEPSRVRTERPATSGQENTTTRRFESSDDRPSRTSTQSESRPSRSESSGRSFDSGSSGRSSGGSSGGGNSGGSSGKTSGGGRGGRN